jgi:hypothetical protein
MLVQGYIQNVTLNTYIVIVLNNTKGVTDILGFCNNNDKKISNRKIQELLSLVLNKILITKKTFFFCVCGSLSEAPCNVRPKAVACLACVNPSLSGGSIRKH